MIWEKPSFVEVDMSAEIGAYHSDLDEPAVPAAGANEPRSVRDGDVPRVPDRPCSDP